MTCIVGLVHNNKVYIGGDSAGVAGFSLQIRADEKVFKKKNFIYGFTSSFRMGQLIRYKFKEPDFYTDYDIDEYLHNQYLDGLIKCFKDNQFAQIKDSEIYGGHFLMGFKGGLYHIQSDFQIAKCITNYNSVGCGEDIALGCLYGIKDQDLDPQTKIIIALEAAENFSAGVRGPFHIVDL